MKLSTKGRYGLRAFVDIAIYSEKEPVSLAEVAKRQDISISYLEQLMTKLKKANLVEAVRGASGGYVLSRKPEDISVGDVLRALEGDLSPVECATEEESCEHSCGATGHCTTRLVWKKINDSVNDTINNIFISELVADSRKGE
ncbi:MAG: Rrf2 family transcriptional regulator [Lachnospiraceae bacterium]|nr:Rrf2 family transcriptional regulator [Lachnospiraceae bacterium]MBO4461833.1 Rrf2 family transcriptional regulator [Lachnospiraceae bacterium]MBR4794815.1 Rrf2 family transcriptional regulator [Lachnospiraceae bacterium]MBR5789085.1 Rrf2 family transcriptional regulator [Lachnospiraceae bacterium]